MLIAGSIVSFFMHTLFLLMYNTFNIIDDHEYMYRELVILRENGQENNTSLQQRITQVLIVLLIVMHFFFSTRICLLSNE